MAGQGSLQRLADVSVSDFLRNYNVEWLTPVAPVCTNLFTKTQSILQILPENAQIIPFARLKGSIKPNDVTSCNADPNLISKTRAFEFV